MGAIYASACLLFKLTQLLSAASPMLLSTSASEFVSKSEDSGVFSKAGASSLGGARFEVTGGGTLARGALKGFTGRRRLRIEMRKYGRLIRPSRSTVGRCEAILYVGAIKRIMLNRFKDDEWCLLTTSADREPFATNPLLNIPEPDVNTEEPWPKMAPTNHSDEVVHQYR